MVDTTSVPHVGLKMSYSEWKVLTVKQLEQPHIVLSSNEYQVDVESKLSCKVITRIYPRDFPGYEQCPQAGETIIDIRVVESVRPANRKNSFLVKFRSNSNGESYEEKYPAFFKYYYYCRWIEHIDITYIYIIIKLL